MSLMMTLSVLATLAPQKAPSSTKEAMRPIQLLVGEWRAQVSPEDGSDGWEETWKWEYRIEKDQYALAAVVKEGKLHASATLSYDLKKKVYRFDAVKPDGTSARFEGKLEGGELVMEEVVEAGAAHRERFSFNLLRDNRILMTIEQRTDAKGDWAATHSYSATKQGVPFVRAEGPKCVVTGGTPESEVAYKGKTYPVCCNSCRKEFLADPEKTLAAARKEGWIK
jgi:YHS domain-containing protein